MISIFKKWELPVIGLAVILLSIVLVRSCREAPPPNVVQIAAEHAAGAIVTVEHADSALARHTRSMTSVINQTKAVAVVRDRVDSLKRTDAPPAQVIATQDTVIATQDSMVVTITEDARQLASTLQTTRDSLALYRKPIIPATTSRPSLAHLGATVLRPTIGYGAEFDGTSVQHGPSVAIGLRLTSGTIGLTAGPNAVYAGGSVHVGVGVTVGVRL